jgi:hypothetical protein
MKSNEVNSSTCYADSVPWHHSMALMEGSRGQPTRDGAPALGLCMALSASRPPPPSNKIVTKILNEPNTQ